MQTVLIAAAWSLLSLTVPQDPPVPAPAPRATHLGVEGQTEDGRELWFAIDLRGGNAVTEAQHAARESLASFHLDSLCDEFNVTPTNGIERLTVVPTATTVSVPSAGGNLLVWTHSERAPLGGEYIRLTAPPRRVLVVGFLPSPVPGSQTAEQQPWLRLDEQSRLRHLEALRLWGTPPPKPPAPPKPVPPKKPQPKKPQPKAKPQPGSGGGNGCPVGGVLREIKKAPRWSREVVHEPIRKVTKPFRRGIKKLGGKLGF